MNADTPIASARCRATKDDFSCLAEVVDARHSVRAYLPTPVDTALIETILAHAARAPSGTNLQPWRVHVLRGESREKLVAAVCARFDANLLLPPDENPDQPEYDYYPREFFSPYLERRRKVGFDLYGLMGIAKGDKLSMARAHRRNFCFFDAPVGLMFSIDRRMGQGSWLDYGMFLQNIMLLARARGLDTCPQAAWTHYHRIIAEQLEFTANEQLVCGMAMGYADVDAAVNKLTTERSTPDEFVIMRN